ncbi:MAG TPA: hypothetical protein VM053_00325 [Gemmatimonadaceae bacterium]|nr:hypothetical protein [Gemmatimonadaceae bacterium]
MQSRKLISLAAGLAFLVVAACSASGETEPGSNSEDIRFEFINTGPCTLVFNFAGGVATPTTGTDHVPSIGARNDVPIYGAGSVSIQIRSAPAGSFNCGFKLGFTRGAPYVLKDPFLPTGYCGGDGSIVTQPAPGRLTSYSGQVVASSSEHC